MRVKYKINFLKILSFEKTNEKNDKLPAEIHHLLFVRSVRFSVANRKIFNSKILALVPSFYASIHYQHLNYENLQI